MNKFNNLGEKSYADSEVHYVEHPPNSSAPLLAFYIPLCLILDAVKERQ